MSQPYETLADFLAKSNGSEVEPTKVSQLTDQGQSANRPRSVDLRTSHLDLLCSQLTKLGEELLEPRAQLTKVGCEPGSGPTLLGGMPGRFQTILKAREAGRKGAQARLLKQSDEERHRVAMTGVAARQQKRVAHG